MTQEQLRLEQYVTAKEKGGTSEEAARANKGRAVVLRQRIVETLRNRGPMTTDECADIMKESILSVRPRFSELKVLGEVRKLPERRLNASGHSARVWGLTKAYWN